MRRSAATGSTASGARWALPALTSSWSARPWPSPQFETTTALSRYRVVQWATGNIGRRALREVIRHPGLDLVGVLVYDDAKDGVDAGELCGEAPTGIRATTDVAATRDLDADCVLYMPQWLNVDDVVALLDSGKNVVTTRGEFVAGGQRLAPDERDRVLEACARGGTSVFSTGSSPGFI